MVLRKDKDQPTTVVTRTAEFLGKGDEHEEREEPYHRSVMERIEDLLGLRKKRKVAAVLWCV